MKSPKLIVITAIAAFIVGFAAPQTSAQTSEAPQFPQGYNNFSMLYRNIDIEDYTMNGVGLEWIHGFSVSTKYPIYIETGAGFNMGLKNEGSGSWAGYGYVNVPINGTYRFTLPNPNMSLSPYFGFELKGNVIGSMDLASSTQEWYSDYDFKRVQLGWHIGCSMNYKKLHVNISYGTDIVKIAKKTDVGTFSLGIGFNW